MQQSNKNFFLGITVIGSMILMAAMIMRFGHLPAELFTSPKIPVEFHAARADGIGNGSAIQFRGVVIGNVTTIELGPKSTYVNIHAALNAGSLPPANVIGKIRTTLLGGNSSLIVDLPPDTEPEGVIGPGQVIQAEFVGVDVLPSAFTDLANELHRTVQDFRESHVINNFNDVIKDVHTLIVRTDDTMQSVQSLVGDQKMQADFHTAVANFRNISETVDRVGANLENFSNDLKKISANVQDVSVHADLTITKAQAHIDDLSRQISERIDQVAKLLMTFQSIAAKVDAGQGTAGRLVNDGQLYQVLTDTVRQLNQTVSDLHRLVDQWEQEGVYLHVTK